MGNESITSEISHRLHKSSKNSGNFVSAHDLQTILDRSTLELLFKKEWKKRRPQVIDDIIQYRLKTLASILLRDRKQTLKSFISWYKTIESTGLKDEDFPEYPVRYFLPNFFEEFSKDHFLFHAATFRDGSDHVFNQGYFDIYREPFLEVTSIGEGYSGKVFRVVIAQGHLKNKNGVLYNKPVKLARKVFGGDRRRISSAARDYAQENTVNNYINDRIPALEEALLYKKFSIVEQDPAGQIASCSLFYELASCNLREAFTDVKFAEIAPPWTTLKDRAALVRQIRNVIHATTMLHMESVLHRDLKPENILFFEDEDEGFKFKLADYGFATEVSSLRPTYSISGAICRSEFQGPEVVTGKEDSVGWGTDDWSLACIVLWVLAYMDKGKTGVDDLTRYKNDYRDDATDETFFEVIQDLTQPVKLVAGVEQYCSLLKENFREKNDFEGEAVSRLIDFLQEHVFVERRKREENANNDLYKHINWLKDKYERWVEGNSGPTPPRITYKNRSGTPHCTLLCKRVKAILDHSAHVPTDLSELERLMSQNSPTEICPRSRHRTSPMHQAIWKDNLQLLGLMLDHGTSIDVYQLDIQYGKTPLTLAGTNGNSEICERLLKYVQRQGLRIRMTDFLPVDSETENRSKIERLIQRYTSERA